MKNFKFTVKVQKLNELVDFDTEQLPDASCEYLFHYGAVQALNDAHASVIKKMFETEVKWLAAVREKVEARVNQIRTGTVPGTRSTVSEAVIEAVRLVKAQSEDAELKAEIEAAMARAAARKAAPKAEAPAEAPAKGKKAA